MYEQEAPGPNRAGQRDEAIYADISVELPLQVNESQAARLRARLEAGRQFYNALLSEGQRRLRKMRADPGLASSTCALVFPETGTDNCLSCVAGAVWVFRICLARLCENRTRLLVG